MTLDQIRRFALSLPEVVEAPHFDRTSFRVCGKIFATAAPEGEYLHVFVSDADRESALSAQPDFLENLPWGKRLVGLRVLLAGAKPHVVTELLARAWSRKAPRRLLVATTPRCE